MRTSFTEKALEILGDIGTNASNLVLLEECVQRLVPFVGAGLSVDFGYPLWGQFLQTTANEFGIGTVVADLLSKDQYEEVAEALTSNGARRFSDALRLTFNDKRLPQRLGRGAVRHLPRIARGAVITTNFDRVLERAFSEAGRVVDAFPGSQIERASFAVQMSESVLLKLHGDYATSESRVLTLSEYAHEYGNPEPDRVDFSRPLPSVLAQALGAGPLLFLGCSLNSDRTTRVIAEIAKRLPGIVHFALLSASENTPDRIRQLDSWNIRPLFFPRGRVEKIEQFLACLADAVQATEKAKRCPHPDLSDVRRSVLGANSDRELRQALYELEKVPKKDIHYVEAMVLKSGVEEALKRDESLLRRSLMGIEHLIQSRRSVQYVALGFLVIASVAAIFAWRGCPYSNKSTKDNAQIEFARTPDLRLELLSTATALELQVRNVGEEPARNVIVEAVAWQTYATAQAFHRVYSEQEVRPQSETSLYKSSNSETRSKEVWRIWGRTDSQSLSGYFVVTCQNCGHYYRAWAFNGNAPGQYSSWALAEFKYPEETPQTGQCVDFPVGSCRPSEQVWASGRAGRQPGPSPAKTEPDVTFKPLK